jgi:hypothetical protein
LGDAARVPTKYIDDLIAGRRRPPLPERTDIYPAITSFLKLGRNKLAACARAERAATPPAKSKAMKPEVRKLLLEVCDAATAKKLEARRAKNGNAELVDFVQRVLNVAQGSVRHMLADQSMFRVAIKRSDAKSDALRLDVLEFLDTTPESLTVKHVVRFITPRINLWDVELQTGVLRVVMQGQVPNQRHARRPNAGYHWT